MSTGGCVRLAMFVGVIGLLFSTTACTATSKKEPPKQAAAPAPQPGKNSAQQVPADGQPGSGDARDIVYFKDGRVAHGQIVDDTSVPGVHLKQADGTWTFKSEDVKFVRRHTPEASADAADRRAYSRPSATNTLASTSWVPRHSVDEDVDPRLIQWSESHTASKECLGKELFDSIKSWKDTVLFVPDGGKITFKHPLQSGLAHAHIFGKNQARERTQQPEAGKDMTLTFGAGGLPEWLMFVTATVEISNELNPKATSTAPGDAFSCDIQGYDQLNGLMARQKFSGGRPTTTPVENGKAWILSTPRGPNQWILMMWDATGEGWNNQLFADSFVAYESTELIPDYSLHVHNKDGKLVGVVSVLPFPPSLSQGAKATKPIHVLSGDRNDPRPIATVAVPSRVALTLPAKAPARKTPVVVTADGTSANMSENLSIAYGTAAPAKGTTLVKDSNASLTAKNSERLFHISFEDKPADQFPIVAWLWIRRTAVFEGGGGLLRIAPPLSIPAAPPQPITGQPIRNSNAHPHLTPLYFAGEGSTITPEARASSAAADGLTGAFMADAVTDTIGATTGTDLSPISNLAGGDTNTSQGMNLNQTFYITPQHVGGPPMYDWRYSQRDQGMGLYGLRLKTGDGNPRPVLHDRMKVRGSINKHGDVFDKDGNLIRRGGYR